MSTVVQLIEKMEALVIDLESQWPDILTRTTQDAVALIEERITTTGTNHEGLPLKPYTKPYEKFKSNPQNYKRGRELGLGSSRFTGKTDYMLTGIFWKDVQIIRQERSGEVIRVVAGITKPENIGKLEGLVKRDGSPFRLSDSEKNILRENTKNYIFDIINKYFPQNA